MSTPALLESRANLYLNSKTIQTGAKKVMKQLVVHVGYPKTATTTLQEKVFTKLQGINYLGKAHYYGSSKRLNKKDQLFLERFNWLRRTYSGIRIENSVPCLPPELAIGRQSATWNDIAVIDPLKFFNKGSFAGFLVDSKVNLLSDEVFTSPYFTPWQADQPERLKHMFDDGHVDIKILFVLREQSRIIESWHAEELYRFNPFPILKNPSNFFFKAAEIYPDYKTTFDYYRQISHYAKTFGDSRIVVALYEDLLNKTQSSFYDKVGKLLNVDSKELERLVLTSEKIRVKEVSLKGEYKVKLSVLDRLGPHSKLRRTLSSMSRNQSNLMSRVISRALIAFLIRYKTDYLIKRFSDDERNQVRKYYLSGNEKLVKFGLLEQSLKKYGYT